MRNMFIFNEHVPNMTFFTCCLGFAIIGETVSPNFNCSITKSLICFDKWAKNVDLSPIFKSPWTCRPFWLKWFCWMKHKFDTCLSKYNDLMVDSILHPLFIEPPHFFWNLVYLCGLFLMGLLFHWCPIFLELHCGFV